MKIKRAVITGATGAIGLALIGKLLSEKIQMLVLVRNESARNQAIPDDPLIRVVPCDMKDYHAFAADQLGNADVFFHLAWAGTTGADRNNMDLQCRNIRYTLDAVDLAVRLGCQKFIGIGSQAEYGRCDEKLTENTPVFPETGYGYAKLCAGLMAKDKARQLGLSFNWVRVLSVYGPGDNLHSLIMSVIDSLKNGKAPELTKGEQIWDYLFSGDAAEALISIAQKGKDGRTYVLGSGRGMQLRDYVEIIRKIINTNIIPAYGAIPYSVNQVMFLCADISALTEDTGWSPKTEFERGIEQVLKTMS